MTLFGSLRAPNAILLRRGLLAGAGALALAACDRSIPLTASETPKLQVERLADDIAALSRRAGPAELGFGLANLESGEYWSFNGERAFPMQGVFKLILGAGALAEAEAGRLDLDERVALEPGQLSPPYSPIADAWPARRDYTARELLIAAVGLSDNTAADVLMRRIGGPGALTAWLQSKQIGGVRVDRYERELQTEAVGLASFRADWRGEAAFVRALETVPPALRRAAAARYLADPRDTATPDGMLGFLAALDAGELVSMASARYLIRIMQRTPTGVRRLRPGLPEGAVLAHKAGTARTDLGLTPAVNDVGIVTLKDRRSYALVVFLAGSTQDEPARERLFTDAARAAVRAMG